MTVKIDGKKKKKKRENHAFKILCMHPSNYISMNKSMDWRFQNLMIHHGKERRKERSRQREEEIQRGSNFFLVKISRKKEFYPSTCSTKFFLLPRWFSFSLYWYLSFLSWIIKFWNLQTIFFVNWWIVGLMHAQYLICMIICMHASCRQLWCTWFWSDAWGQPTGNGYESFQNHFGKCVPKFGFFSLTHIYLSDLFFFFFFFISLIAFSFNY